MIRESLISSVLQNLNESQDFVRLTTIQQYIWKHENDLACIQKCFSRFFSWFAIFVKDEISFHRVTFMSLFHFGEFVGKHCAPWRKTSDVSNSMKFLPPPDPIYFSIFLIYLSKSNKFFYKKNSWLPNY